MEKTHIPPTPELEEMLLKRGTPATSSGASLKMLLRRPEISYESLSPFDPGRGELTGDQQEQVEISIKYEGYIEKQLRHVEEFKRSESRALPEDMDYSGIDGLRLEARQKLDTIRPASLGQASRISGVSAADLTALMLFLENIRRNSAENN